MSDFLKDCGTIYSSFTETMRKINSGEITQEAGLQILRAIKEEADRLGVPLKLGAADEVFDDSEVEVVSSESSEYYEVDFSEESSSEMFSDDD